MRILGIIAEYDPFHRGHAWHLQRAKETVAPDFTYIVLSGCVKQRGELAMLSPYARAKCALERGADAVFALPAAWTARDAEHYALGAVAMMRMLGVTHLAFGAEENNPERLRDIAWRLEHPEENFQRALRAGLDRGEGYPRAVSQALEACCPGAGAVMNRPNNTLGVCYLRAMDRLGTEMEPVLIPRAGDYHAERIDPLYPSASALRGALFRGDWGGALKAVPEESEKIIRRAFLEGKVPREELYGQMILRRLREMTAEEAGLLPDLSEGLGDRIRAAAGRAGSREELLEAVCAKRYPRARISRVLFWAALGVRAEELQNHSLPEKAVLLGMRRSRGDMTALWKKKRGLIATRWEDSMDLKAWRLWAQCAGQPDSLPWTERVVTI